MDWLSLRATYQVPRKQPERCGRLLALGRVLDGTQYDLIPHDFAKERSGADEYIPLSMRRPAVRTNLCRTVVDESVSLLFGDTHWPAATAEKPETADALTQFVQAAQLPTVMIRAATRGAVGSVALLVEAFNGALSVSVMDTAYLTPAFAPDGTLESVSERYEVSGAALTENGYAIPEDQARVRFWYERVWDTREVRVMVPRRVEDDASPVRDNTRSVVHEMGFVPIVWIRNLASQATGDVDGACTFERAIDTVIEADYLLSQGGRALRYASDPTLVISAGAPDGGDGAARTGGAASALNLPPTGDAKLLEINGRSSAALLDHYRELRALVLEQLHGNRAHADKLSAAQSGRAMEMMCQSLIWLADQLRQSYGDGGSGRRVRQRCSGACRHFLAPGRGGCLGHRRRGMRRDTAGQGAECHEGDAPSCAARLPRDALQPWGLSLGRGRGDHRP